MVDLPLDGKPLAQGLGYRQDATPETDAAKIPAGMTSRKPDALPSTVAGPNTTPDLDPVSLETREADAPQNVPFFWNSGYPMVPGAPGSYRTSDDPGLPPMRTRPYKPGKDR